VLIFDLDHFKCINDGFGHAIGDETLRLFAAVAARTLRASDLVARFGGEEFVAMLPGTIDDATVAAERVRTAFRKAGKVVADRPVEATVSVGAASARGAADIGALLAAADAALYQAKMNGRDRVERAAAAAKSAMPSTRDSCGIAQGWADVAVTLARS
jgi:diguanylate cyclase (GGDEF)-like protein